jgi:hypothetical protein
MKNLYEIDSGSSTERYFAVAESYAEAEKLWEEEYQSAPDKITYITPYVLVQGDKE